MNSITFVENPRKGEGDATNLEKKNSFFNSLFIMKYNEPTET